MLSVQVFYVEPIVIPERYGRRAFWTARLLLAVAGGALAVAYGISTPILAANVGAATPAIIQTLTQGFRLGG